MNKDLYLHGYAVGASAHDTRIAKVLKLASKRHAESLLDIGCGDGAITVLMGQALEAKNLLGVEISEIGAQEASQNGVKCFAVDIDHERVPLPDDSLDFIYAGEVIEHLYDPDFMLDEIYRLLKPGGYALIDTPNLASWFDRLFILMGYQPVATESSLRLGSAGKFLRADIAGGGGHLRILTLRAFKQVLASHGFALTRVAGGGGDKSVEGSHLPKVAKGSFNLLNGFFSRFPSLAAFLIVEVRK